MKLVSLLVLFTTLVAIENTPISSAQSLPSSGKTTRLEEHRMDPLAGKTIRWKFVDGPMAGTTFEHTFSRDGSVTWRIADGEHKGASAREKSYAAVKVNERTVAVSYLAASGYTLTVVLNLDNGQMFGFASNHQEWQAIHGTFEFIE